MYVGTSILQHTYVGNYHHQTGLMINVILENLISKPNFKTSLEKKFIEIEELQITLANRLVFLLLKHRQKLYRQVSI